MVIEFGDWTDSESTSAIEPAGGNVSAEVAKDGCINVDENRREDGNITLMIRGIVSIRSDRCIWRMFWGCPEGEAEAK